MSEDQRPPGRSRTRAERAYALLLRLYPRAHRQAFGEQMLQAFRDHYRDAVEAGGESSASFWLGVIGDEGKSLLREHSAALAGRKMPVTKLLTVWEPAAIAAGLALLVLLVDFTHLNNVSTLLAGIPIYLALFFLVVRALRGGPRPAGAASWWRLGLTLGGIVGLYMLALDLLDALAPIPGPQDRYGDNVGPVWALSLPLLAGVVGVVAGYAGGRVRTAAAAGLLAGGLVLALQLAGTVALVVALWGPLQANALHSQLQAGTQDWIQHQWSVQHPGAAPSLWTYLTNGNDDASIAFGVIFKSVYTAVAWVIPVIAGGAIGARAARQARDVRRPAAGRAFGRTLRFTVLLLVLGILMWSAFAVVASRRAGGTPPPALDFLGASFATPAFVAWLLVFLVMVAAVYAAVRPARVRSAAGAA